MSGLTVLPSLLPHLVMRGKIPSDRLSQVLTKGESLPESDLHDSQSLERPAPCSDLGSHAAAKRVLITREAAICSSDWYQPIRPQFPTKSICGNSLVDGSATNFSMRLP